MEALRDPTAPCLKLGRLTGRSAFSTPGGGSQLVAVDSRTVRRASGVSFLGPPVVPFYRSFLGEGSPTKIDYRQKEFGYPSSILSTGGPCFAVHVLRDMHRPRAFWCRGGEGEAMELRAGRHGQALPGAALAARGIFRDVKTGKSGGGGRSGSPGQLPSCWVWA